MRTSNTREFRRMKLIVFCALACVIAACSSGENSNKAASEASTEKKSHTCLSVIETIITTSERFKEEVGEMDYVMLLERSPYPIRDNAMDEGEFYEFSFAEDLEDHISTIARFLFDPEQKTLFIYDPIEDEQVEVPYDKQLMATLRSSCV